MSSHATVRWKYDPATRVAVKTIDDGVRTHIRFFNDVPGIPNEYTRDAQEEGAMGNADENQDSSSISTPKAESDSNLSDGSSDKTARRHVSSSSRAPTRDSRSPSISQWTRRAPIVPDFFADAPGSDAATEITARVREVRESTSGQSRGTASHVSGTTQGPDSEGHAGPESAYFVYQQAPTRTFKCKDPKTALRAQGKLVIERCYATENNLGVSRRVAENFDSEVELQSRFSSPAPSCQYAPSSLCIREQTPFSERSGPMIENHSLTAQPSFDLARWRWVTDEEMCATDNSLSASDTLVPEDVWEHKGKYCAADPDSDSDSVTYSKIFGREGSPLTELSEEMER